MKAINNLYNLSESLTSEDLLSDALNDKAPRTTLAQKRLNSSRDFVLVFAGFWDFIVQYKPKKMRDRSILFNNIHDNAHHVKKGRMYSDFETVEFSKTNVPGVDNVTLTSVADNRCTLIWNRQQGHRTALAANTADVVLFFYNETKATTAFFMQVPYPTATKVDLVLPDYSLGDVIHCWTVLHWEKERIISDIEYAIIDV